jgi:putative chitinase
MKITSDQLHQIGASLDNSVKFVDLINDTLLQFEINTPLRVQHFLAQVMHESGAFHYLKELASGAAYEGRKDLGNIHEGDGIKFKGRGLIQITGRANYVSIGNDLHEDFIINPELLETPKYATLSAGWFWNKHGLNVLADADDIIHITKRINGGLNGIEDRENYLRKAKLFILE